MDNNAIIINGNDIDMSKICGCVGAKTLSDCEACGKYYHCNNVAIANDVLAMEDIK